MSFVQKQFLPEEFESGLEEQISGSRLDPKNEDAPPGEHVVDNGQAVPEGGTLEVDTIVHTRRSWAIRPSSRPARMSSSSG